MFDYEIEKFVKWAREITGRSVNITCTIWAFSSNPDSEPKHECRIWIDEIVNKSYSNIETFVAHIPKLKEYILLHKEFTQ